MGTKVAASRLASDSIEGARLIGIEKMPVEEWLAIPDNPIQRNTEKRAKTARHLRTLDPAHYVVAMAKYKGNGRREKVDGHTRAFIWENTLTGDDEPQCDQVPRDVTVQVYEVRDQKDSEALYERFDSREAVERAADEMFGGLRKFDLQPLETSWMAQGHIKSGLIQATGALTGPIMKGKVAQSGGGTTGRHLAGDDIRNLVDIWAPELVMIDQIHPHRNRTPTAVFAAMFWVAIIYGREGLDFIKKAQNHGGVKKGLDCDAVFFMEQVIDEARTRKISEIAGSTLERAMILTDRYLRYPNRLYHNEPWNRRDSDFMVRHATTIAKKKGLLKAIQNSNKGRKENLKQFQNK